MSPHEQMLIERGLANETPAEREARLVYERAVIAQARAEIDAGLGIDQETLYAFLHELDRNPDAPLPRPSAKVG